MKLPFLSGLTKKIDLWYPDETPYKRHKILSSFITLFFALLVVVVYSAILLFFRHNTNENLPVYIVIMIICVINLILIRKGIPGFVVPSFAVILFQAQWSFFMKLPVYADITVLSVLAFSSLIWVFISYRWWHLLLNVVNAVIAIIIRFVILYNNHTDGSLSEAAFQGAISAYFLLICIIGLSILAYRYIDRENRLVEKEILAHQASAGLMNDLLNAAAFCDITDTTTDSSKWEYFFDPLTGCLNRLAFNKLFSTFLKENVSAQRVVSLVFVDLNQLKHVNDTYGHSSGDQYLKSFSDTLKRSIAPNNVLYRVGGDEFVIVFVDVNAAEIKNKMDEVLTQLAYATRPIGFDGSFSYGLALSSEESIKDSQDLLTLADSRMYEMKRAFRNPSQMRASMNS